MALTSADFTTLLTSQSSSPAAARDLALALKKPVEHSLEDLRFRPKRAAELIGPLLEAALVQHDERRLERLKERGWRAMAIIVNPSLWALSIKALWDGTPVWDYLEQRKGWYQVVEAVLVDSRTHDLLAKADAPGRRHRSSDEPLHSLAHTTAPSSIHDSGADSGQGLRDNQVLVLVGERCRLSVRVCGLPPETLRPKLQSICLAADRLLENAKVDPRALKVMVSQLIEKALIKNCPSASPWTRRTGIFGTLMALGLFAAVCLGIGLEERRWQSAVQAFYDEPGIQVLGESSAWGRHEIHGLRDPFARTPADILRSKGIHPSKVTTRFKPYVSADELMMQLRQSESTRSLMTIGAQVSHNQDPKPAKP
jgi:hypothetical protein